MSSKVIKSFSLDIETVRMLEEYSRSMEDWNNPSWSRSKVVNDAIRWFLSGDTAELVHNNEKLLDAVKRANRAITEPKRTNLPWWRRLLLGR